MKLPNQKKHSVLIALIHNNNLNRISVIRQNLKKLTNILSNQFNVSSVEISYQPKLLPHGKFMSLRRELAYLILRNKWSNYKLIKITAIKKYTRMVISLLAILKKYSLNINSIRERWQKSSAIEMRVTDKHIRSWDMFLESNCETLLMFEDDAIFKADSFEKLLYAVNEAHKIPRETLLYVDLAGGLPLQDLEISHLAKEKKDGITIYTKPVTNTGSAYLLNRSMAEEFKELIVDYPNYRLFGGDWMMNQLFIDIERRNKKTHCFHFEPSALNHGSFTGDYSPWTR